MLWKGRVGLGLLIALSLVHVSASDFCDGATTEGQIGCLYQVHSQYPSLYCLALICQASHTPLIATDNSLIS